MIIWSIIISYKCYMSPGNGLIKLQKVMAGYTYVHVFFSISETNYFSKIAFQIGC